MAPDRPHADLHPANVVVSDGRSPKWSTSVTFARATRRRTSRGGLAVNVIEC
jgi:predicted unusual protein kinase regulating ubiquinone biosynthesis (AarF/ABC1/UbiB family)